MKKVIVNNDKIRVTANGQSIVEGSFARVTEIRGKSVECKNLLKTLPIDQINSAEDVSNYATITRSNSGGYGVFIKQKPENGVKYIAFTLDLKNLLHSGKYFLSGSCKHKNNDYYLVYLHLFGYYTDGTSFTFNDFGEGTEVFIDPNKEIREVYCYFQFDFNNDTENFLVNRHFTFFPMLNEGSSPLPYQPYFEGLKHSKIKGIYSNNRNLLSKEQSMLISDGYAGSAYPNQDLIDLINLKNVNSLNISSNYKSNTIVWRNENPRLGIKLEKDNGESNSTSKNYKTYNGIIQKRNLAVYLKDNDIYTGGVFWFNDFGNIPIGVEKENSYISYQNQLEIGETPTRYVESESYEYNLPSEITLRSSIDDESIYDVYYPEEGLIFRCINEDGTIKSTPIFEDITPTAYNGYKAFNNGFEKLISSIDSNNLTPYDYGAIPKIVVEYEVEPKQGADRTRFDFITLDGEAICGIGYEKLKSTNQLQYVEEPDRQNDGSMSNIEDYDTFVLPALEVGFNCINEETYRRLKHKLISKRTFDVGYYDKDLDKVVTMEMYVKPIDLDNFLSYGDDIIGMNFSISFVPTLNEETLFSVTFLNSDYNTIIKEYSGNNGVLYGRAITTPALPSGYKYWLMIESGFKENTYVKIKGNKKLSIFGNTKLIAVK